MDVVVAYKGSEREDSLFEILHEDNLSIGGIPVDINPIKEDKSGTLQTYLPETEQYLAKKQEAQEKPQRISIKEKLKGKQTEVNKNAANKHKSVAHGKNNIDL